MRGGQLERVAIARADDVLPLVGRGETDASATSTGAAPVAIIAPASVTFTQVSPAYYGYVALASDGTVWSWGLNSVGTSGQGTLLDSGAVSPAIVGTPTMIPSLSNVTQIAGAAYGAHVCARISDGSVKCWGYDNLSQVGIAPVDGGQPYQITPVTVAF